MSTLRKVIARDEPVTPDEVLPPAKEPPVTEGGLEAGATEGGLGGLAPRLLPIVSELFILTKDLRLVRLGDVMNYAQRDFIARCEQQLRTSGQIRICVLKARQIGISTIIEAIAFTLSMMFDNFHSKIVSHEDKSASSILAMTKRYWSTYPFKDFHTEKYNGRTHLAWSSGADIDIATAKNLGAGRSQTIQLLHASEVAFWPDPKTLMTGLQQAIPTYGLTAVFLESTANGVGNYFHKTCNSAMRGESEFEFVFYPWYEHPEYTAAFIPEEQARAITLDNLDDEEERLREKFGVSDARLMWRRWAIINKCQGDLNIFHQEYPATPHEAFVSTGRNVFPLGDMMNHYEPLIGERGRLISIGGRVKFIEDPGGPLTVFAEPSDDKDWGVYLLGGDPTHTTAGDYACVQVLNRRTLEQVAVYRRKIDPINFGKDMQLLGHWYNDGMLAPERTGPGYATIGCIVSDGYPYVYATQNVAKLQGFHTGDAFGWVTNLQTKHLAISHLLKALLDPLVEANGQTFGLLIHDETTFLEMRDYVTLEDGHGYGNSDGSEYDDGVMALAIAMAVHAYEPPPPPYEQPSELVAKRRYQRVSLKQPGGRGGFVTSTMDLRPTDKRVAVPDHSDQTRVEDIDAPTAEFQPSPVVAATRLLDASESQPSDALPRLEGFPDDFTDDEPPWERWPTKE